MRVALGSVALLLAISLSAAMPDPQPAAARHGLFSLVALPEEVQPMLAAEAVAAQAPPVLLRFSPLELPAIEAGGSTVVQLLLENADPLFGVDLTVTFDPGLLAATEIEPGDLLPDARVVKRDIDNAAGTVRYVATLLGDAVPIASTGIVASIRFDALAVGSARLGWDMEMVKLSDRESNPLVGRPDEATLVVAGPTATPSPTATRTPTVTRTPTATRTPRPTAAEDPEPPASNPPAPEPTSTPHPTHTPGATPTPQPAATHVPGATPMEGTAFPTATAAPGEPRPTGGPNSPWDRAGWTAQIPLPTPGPLTGVVFPPEPPSGIPTVQGDGFVALLEPTPGVGVVATSLGGAGVEIRVDNMGGSVALRFQPLDGLPEGVALPPDTGVARVFSLDLYGYESDSNSAHRIVYGEGRGSAPIVLRWGLSEEEYDLTLDDRGVPHPDRLAFYRLTPDGRLVRLSAAWGPEPAPYGSVTTVFVDRSTFLLALMPPEEAGRTALSDPRYFPETGFRVGGDSFWDYFSRRGGLGSFGYPVSREFTLSGFRVQLFQRAILQALPDGSVATMNLLDGGVMPYTRINASSFPVADPDLAASAPSPSDPDYAELAIAFLDANVPDRWNGLPVGFRRAYLSRVGYEDAFPDGHGDPALLPLLNLEMWGLPTSRPAYDPGNNSFVYQRFQRGILHYDLSTGATQGLLLADYLKGMMTGRDLPPDLEEQARGSPFFRQYDRARPGHTSRPEDLPGTNLVGAFEMDVPQEVAPAWGEG